MITMKKIIWIYLIIINILTFLIFGIDKHKAKKDRRRISEKTLLSFSVLGGCFLEFIGMYFFHHKTKKFKFYFINILAIITYTYLIAKYLI